MVPMIYGTISQTGVGRPGQVIPLVPQNLPFMATVAVSVTGTATYSIQHTLDDPYSAGFSAQSANWFDHTDDNFVNATTGGSTNYILPVHALSVIVTSGTGIVTVQVLQAGSRQ